MNSKICTLIKACSVADAQNVTKDSITIKPGKSFIIARAIKPTTFTIKSYDTPAGFRSDFSMSVFFKNEEVSLLKKNRRSLLLQLSTSDNKTQVIGSSSFPVKASFSKDINVSSVEFTQSEPG